MKTMNLIGGLLLLLLTVNAVAESGDKVGGGGNTINGHLIEEYAIDAHSIASYKKNIVPIIQLAGKRIEGIDSKLQSIFDKKTWYMLPVHLKELPRSVTGLPAASDQTVVQTADSVWIDATEFQAMSEYSQTLMLLHEMGLYLVVGDVDSDREFGGPSAHAKARRFAATFPEMLKTSDKELADYLQELFPFRYRVILDLADYPEMSLNQLFQRLSSMPNKFEDDTWSSTETMSWNATNQALTIQMQCEYKSSYIGRPGSQRSDQETVLTQPVRWLNPDGHSAVYTSYSSNLKLAKPGDVLSFVEVQFFDSSANIFSGKITCTALNGNGACDWKQSTLAFCQFHK
jgi:hypothetical protein